MLRLAGIDFVDSLQFQRSVLKPSNVVPQAHQGLDLIWSWARMRRTPGQINVRPKPCSGDPLSQEEIVCNQTTGVCVDMDDKIRIGVTVEVRENTAEKSRHAFDSIRV